MREHNTRGLTRRAVSNGTENGPVSNGTSGQSKNEGESKVDVKTPEVAPESDGPDPTSSAILRREENARRRFPPAGCTGDAAVPLHYPQVAPTFLRFSWMSVEQAVTGTRDDPGTEPGDRTRERAREAPPAGSRTNHHGAAPPGDGRASRRGRGCGSPGPRAW